MKFIKKYPNVGVAGIVMKKDKVLLGKRINSHGDGTLSFPGGHLEYGESIEECVIREVREETDLNISLIDSTPFSITNDIFEQDNKHYVTLYLRGKYFSGEAKVMEPRKSLFWDWFTWEEVLSRKNELFLPIQNLIKQGYNPFNQSTIYSEGLEKD
jgi:8-oxo-dGTP diphosphatase